MINTYEHILAKGKPDYTPLFEHLCQVAYVTEKTASYTGLDKEIARCGALLHDIGKASPIFQERLDERFRFSVIDAPFRHEIASLFFLPLFDETIHPQLIEMVVAHHKSIKRDIRQLGIIDLEDRFEDVFELHIKDWEAWSSDALGILETCGVATRQIKRNEAEDAYYKSVDYCWRRALGYSLWKGLMIASDHFASALIDESEKYAQKIFTIPDVSFYNSFHELYPLSHISTDSPQKHTIVTASTGAGKTDFLLKRCKGRIFYTLPFQASINAMYKRIKNDLTRKGQDVPIHALHAASRLLVHDGEKEEKVLQGLVGSSIKVLTPHQIASIVFGTRGYEAMIVDIQGCDVILDEIHTYTSITQAIVLKIVEILTELGCSIHIGTATMPSQLYRRILDILGEEHVYQVRLSGNELNQFDRHRVHKVSSYEKSWNVIAEAVEKNQKVLIVSNTVKTAQQRFEELETEFSHIPLLLIHSRFRRKDRQDKELELMELNNSNTVCIVVSTQVVEVSLDISFDVMITDAAPLDALIQRFGRINRKRSQKTIGKYKPVYVISPPESATEAKPYEFDSVLRSFEILPDQDVLHEADVQAMIDSVFPEIDTVTVEKDAIFKQGKWSIEKLIHKQKSILLEILDIDSAVCILEKDRKSYENTHFEEQMGYEIPVSYRSVAYSGLDGPLKKGNKPFIVPDSAYSEQTGLDMSKVKPENYNTEYQFL